MTDIEIDKALALAIGWKDEPNKMRVSDFWGLQVWIGCWANFSHKDWDVIGPIAKQFRLLVDFKTCVAWQPNMSVGKRGDTPQKAIALAAINGAKK
jgi:hypothetical protein